MLANLKLPTSKAQMNGLQDLNDRPAGPEIIGLQDLKDQRDRQDLPVPEAPRPPEPAP